MSSLERVQNRTSACDDGGDENRSAAAAPPPDGEEEEICWLCLDANHESGLPLRRDCSCRGGSGFAHLPCIVEYAMNKNEQWRTGYSIDSVDEYDFDIFVTPWGDCPNCKQYYGYQLTLDLANALVSLVEEKYPGDKLIYMHALYQKLDALAYRTSQPKQTEEAKQIGNEILNMIVQMKNGDSSLPENILRILQHTEANVYHNLAFFEEDAKTAVGYYEKYRDFLETTGHGDKYNVAVIEQSIIELKSTYDESIQKLSDEEELKQSQEIYNARVGQFGEDADPGARVLHGTALATELCIANRKIESERLLKNLVSVSKQLHGPNHSVTKNVEENLLSVRQRLVVFEYQGELKVFKLLRYEEDGEKCIVQGPMSPESLNNADEHVTLTVATEDVRPQLGSPVVCHGLVEAPLNRLNGKIGDVRSRDKEVDSYSSLFSCSFKVHFEDKDLEPCFLKPENLRILFGLPNE